MRTKWIFGLALVSLLLAGLAVWYMAVWRTPKTTTKTTAVSSTIPKSSHQASSGGTTTKGGDAPTSTPLSGTIIPEPPAGQFVSDHSPHLSGSSGPTVESSTCITTPGAYCQITFTQGTTTRALPKKQADGNGNVLWDSWTPASVHVTEGTWHIAAVASNGSHTVSSIDALDLSVEP